MAHRTRAMSTVAALVAAGLLAAGCSSDSKSNGTTTAAPGTTTAATTTTAPALTGAGLKVGLLAPSPGLLGTLFQAQTRGVGFAAADIAAGGGVNGGPLNAERLEPTISQTETDMIAPAVDKGTTLFVGPAGSDSAGAALPELERTRAMACSASATAPDLTADQKELTLFRTAVPDDVLVTYLTGFIAQRQSDAKASGWKVAVIARDDAYGHSVGNTLVASLGAAGLAPTLYPYNPNQVVFDSVASQVAAAKPDQTVVVSYEEGANVVDALLKAKQDPKKMIGLDAFFAPRVASLATTGQPSAADGFTIVGTGGTKDFIDRLIADDPNGQVAYAAQAYDCAITLALASAEVASKKASTIALAVQDVTGGGVTCTTYADCLNKLNSGENIDYDGPSGKLGIDAHGDATSVRFTTAELSGGKITKINNSDVDLADMARVREAWGSANFTTQLQQALRFLGFYDGPINGVWTTETSDALKEFQKSVGLEPTGIYDAATDAALRKALGSYGALMSSSIKDMQQLLTDLGYYKGPIDGIWNDETTAAIKAFQKDLGVPQTGVVDAATLKAVFQRGLDTPPTTTTPAPTTVAPTTVAPTTVAPTTAPPTTAPPTTTTAPPKDTLFQTLSADPDFSTLVELLDAAGFRGQFQLVGPYTVFAPTNEAFAKLPAGTLDKLKADPEGLRALLAFHVAEGRYPEAKIVDGLVTISGAPLKVTGTAAGGDLTVNGAKIVKADIEASNGIVQGVDTVLTPPYETTTKG